MDEENLVFQESNDVVENVVSGSEPGASADHYLDTNDNIDHIEDEIENEREAKPHRPRNGTISKIKKDIRKQQQQQNVKNHLDSVRASDNYASSDDAGNSSATSANASESEEFAQSSVSDVDLHAETNILTEKIEGMRLHSLSVSSDDYDSDLAYVQSLEWKNKKKHIFVLSQSGKPIYSRYGNEEKLVTIFGVMQALVSFVTHSESEDTLRCIVAEDRKFVFLVKEHLVLVAVSSLNECIRHLQLQLHYVYSQIISILTLNQLNKIYQQRVNYDLRRMLGGTEKFLDNILTVMESDPSYLLCSVRCLPLSASVRENVTQTILQCCKVKDLVFAIIISDNQLVSLVRMKKFSLHPQDLHILLNMVQSSDYFKTAEAWLPVCLPKFDNSGFLHAYVSYLDEPCNACLILLTVDNEQFSLLSDCRHRIVERLNRYSCLQAIAESVSSKGYTTQQVGIPDLRHFIYKSRSTAQFTSPKITAPYMTVEQRERLHGLYLSVHGRMHNSDRPLSILYETLEYESVLGWLTDGFELYAVFSPLITKSAAITCVNKLFKWIKKEESRLFILGQTTF